MHLLALIAEVCPVTASTGLYNSCSMSTANAFRKRHRTFKTFQHALLALLFAALWTSWTSWTYVPPVAPSQKPLAGSLAKRRTLALLVFSQGSPAEATEGAAPSEPLRFLSGLANTLLKPIYSVEAPLQAGNYNKEEVRQRINEDVKSQPVVIYSYSLSPFCSQAKELLASLGVQYKEIDLAPEWIPGLLSTEGAAVRAELGAMTGQTSMPHIFIGGESIGGLFTGTPGLVPLQEAGELQAKLKAAGAL